MTAPGRTCGFPCLKEEHSPALLRNHCPARRLSGARLGGAEGDQAQAVGGVAFEALLVDQAHPRGVVADGCAARESGLDAPAAQVPARRDLDGGLAAWDAAGGDSRFSSRRPRDHRPRFLQERRERWKKP